MRIGSSPTPLVLEFSKPLLCAPSHLSWSVRHVSDLIRPGTHFPDAKSARGGLLTIGAWAVIAHGYVRATADIDFVARLDRDNMVRLAGALTELNAKLRGVDADKLGIDVTDPSVLENGATFTMDTDAGPLDFLNDVPGADDYDHMRSRARQANTGPVMVWVVGLEDRIRMKEASGREQDLLDVHKLREQQSSPEN